MRQRAAWVVAALLATYPIAAHSEETAAATESRGLNWQGARAALITLGSDGALYCDAERVLHCPALPVQAVDTTAAGDAYLGALAAARAESQTLEQSLGFAAAAAGLAVTRLGAQPSLGTRAEVADFIARHGLPVIERG